MNFKQTIIKQDIAYKPLRWGHHCKICGRLISMGNFYESVYLIDTEIDPFDKIKKDIKQLVRVHANCLKQYKLELKAKEEANAKSNRLKKREDEKRKQEVRYKQTDWTAGAE